jgi:hypothetical protein
VDTVVEYQSGTILPAQCHCFLGRAAERRIVCVFHAKLYPPATTFQGRGNAVEL